MKILLVNKFLYPRGGDCIYTLGLAQILREAGHTVRFYAMDFPENIPDMDRAFFAGEINISSGSLSEKVKAVNRILWGTGVKKGFESLLNDFQPDIVHLNNIHSYLSPLIARLAHKQGAKVFWTLHDYKLLCPTYNCLYKGEVCEACFSDKRDVILRRCMKNSLSASILAWGEAVYWNKKKLSMWTDAFICPSKFMADKMKQGGFPAEKLQIIHNFISTEQANSARGISGSKREECYAYIGRLSEEKGVESLLEAATRLPYKLYIAGNGPLKEAFMQKYTSDNIIFLGHLSAKEISDLLKKVSFTVIPSIWYENNPLSVIESLCNGTPVIGRAIGGIPELLETNDCNRLFTQDNELPALIHEMFASATSIHREELSYASLQRFSSEVYYQKWLQIAERHSKTLPL